MYFHITACFHLTHVVNVSRTIEISKEIDDWIYKFGINGLYISNSNEDIISVERSDTFQPVKIIDDIEKIIDADVIYLLNEYFNGLEISHISEKHINCNGKKICGCGCDKDHDGGSGRCYGNYPVNAYVISKQIYI